MLSLFSLQDTEIFYFSCENIVIVACPLNSIVKDPINVLMSREISADVLGISENVGTQSLTLLTLLMLKPNARSWTRF